MADVRDDPRRPLAGGVFGIRPQATYPLPSSVFAATAPPPGWLGRQLGLKAGPYQSYPQAVDAPAGLAASYGSGFESMLEPGGHTIGVRGFPDPSPKMVSSVLQRAALAIRRNPVASLGFDPRRIAFFREQKNRAELAGKYQKSNDMSFVNTEFPSTVVHESIHRGIETLRRNDLFPKELEGYPEEKIARYLMQLLGGNPEVGRSDRVDMEIENARWDFEDGGNATKYRAGLSKLLNAATQLIAKQRPGGPR